MKLRTVVHLLSGSIITSTWAGGTDEEFDHVREMIGRSLLDGTFVGICPEADPPSVFSSVIKFLAREVYIPVRNIDTITIETASDDSTAAVD